MKDHPASPAQDTHFTLAAGTPDPAVQPAQLSVSFGEPVPEALLRGTWAALALARGILRSGYRKGHGRPMVRIEHEKAEPSWRDLDWSDVPREELAARWAQAREEEAARPVDPLLAPPIRFLTIRLPGGSTHLLATHPRFVFDEESWFFLLCEWLEALDGKLPQTAEAPEAAPVRGEAGWWAQHLAGATPRSLRFFGGSAPPNEHQILFDRETTAALAQACAGLDAHPRDAVLSAWALLMGRLSPGDRALLLASVETPGALSDDLGARLNLLPVQVALPQERTLAALVREVAAIERARQQAATVAIDALPLPEGLHPRAAGFAAAFQWLPPALNERVPDVFPRWINMDARLTTHAIHPLELEGREGARLSLRLRSASLPPAEVSRLLNAVEEILATLIASPQTALRAIALPDNPATPTRDGEPSVRPVEIQNLIADTANASPHLHAVEDADGAALTFREVDDYATLLASHLQSENLGEGWTVSVCLTPSPWVPVALLGILRAGDTLVPLDPDAPHPWLCAQAAATDSELVVCDSGTQGHFEASGRTLLVIDREWERIAAASPADREPPKPKVALVLTGNAEEDPPPLAQLPPALLSMACARTIQAAGIEAGERVAVTAPSGSAAHAVAILSSLVAGATAILAKSAGFAPIADTGAQHAWLTAAEFSGWASALASGAPDFPGSLRSVLVDARRDAVFEASLALWRRAAGTRCRFVSFLSPCDTAGVGLQWTEEDGQGPRGEGILPAGRPSKGSGFSIEDPAGRRPPFGYPGVCAFRPAGVGKPCGGFTGWSDAEGMIFRLPADERHAEVVAALRAVDGVTDAAWNPASPGTAWFVGDVPERAVATAVATRLSPALVPSLLVRVPEIPLRHGRVDTGALRVPTETPSPAPPAPQDSPQPDGDTSATGAAETHPAPKVAPQAAVPAVQMLGGALDAPLLVVLDTPSPGGFAALIASLGSGWRLATTGFPITGGDPETEGERVGQVLADMAGGEDIHLLGLRGGALVAIEAARFLRAMGREVPYLVIAGAAPPREKQSGWLGALARGLGRTAGPLQPLEGPCGILLTKDMPANAEDDWIAIAPDAVVERITCSSHELTGGGARQLAHAMHRMDAGPEDQTA
jgi:non-ribosomal peptide synthetase component F